jgi:hypothetical protein
MEKVLGLISNTAQKKKKKKRKDWDVMKWVLGYLFENVQ